MMSAISEILKLAPKVKIGALLEGIANDKKIIWNLLPQDQRDEILRRRDICFSCPYSSERAKRDGYETDRTDKHCTMCGCPISYRTASLSSNCGIEVWNEENPENKKVLKWKAFEKKFRVNDFIIKKK